MFASKSRGGRKKFGGGRRWSIRDEIFYVPAQRDQTNLNGNLEI